MASSSARSLRPSALLPRTRGIWAPRIGFFAVLHTWGQTLVHHPHLHCVVPGGGLSPDGTRWIACRPGFFLPVRVLSRLFRLFRRLLLSALEAAFDADALHFGASLEALRDRRAFLQHLAPARQAEWVVYAKPPFAGPQQVLDYVGRYTHRIAISDSRLVNVNDGQVTFRYKNYRDDRPTPKTMMLPATEFLRRFLLHVLPAGFHRIRYYGLMGNRHRIEKLARCRQLLGTPAPPPPASTRPADYRDRYQGPHRQVLAGLSCLSRRTDAPRRAPRIRLRDHPDHRFLMTRTGHRPPLDPVTPAAGQASCAFIVVTPRDHTSSSPLRRPPITSMASRVDGCVPPRSRFSLRPVIQSP